MALAGLIGVLQGFAASRSVSMGSECALWSTMVSTTMGWDQVCEYGVGVCTTHHSTHIYTLPVLPNTTPCPNPRTAQDALGVLETPCRATSLVRVRVRIKVEESVLYS